MKNSVQEEILTALWLLDGMFALWAGWHIAAGILFCLALWCFVCSIGAAIKEYKRYKEQLNDRKGSSQ